MVKLQTAEPKVLNGVFAVPKSDNRQRFKIEARPANAHLIRPEKVLLPNPGDLGRLQLRAGSQLIVGKSDMDEFYHRLQMPEWFCQYFGLPSVSRESGVVWPVVRVLPMGWSHSVLNAQLVHEEIVRRAGLNVGSALQKCRDPFDSDMRHGEYINDLFLLGTDSHKNTGTLETVLAECQRTL